jgi:hypothetical protein
MRLLQILGMLALGLAIFLRFTLGGMPQGPTGPGLGIVVMIPYIAAGIGLFFLFLGFLCQPKPALLDPSQSRENEAWIVKTGGAVIEKRSSLGETALTDLDRMTYCLWVVDYGMRNAGDLNTVLHDMRPTVLSEGALLARELGLRTTEHLFGMSRRRFEKNYFELFDAACAEIKSIAESKD